LFDHFEVVLILLEVIVQVRDPASFNELGQILVEHLHWLLKVIQAIAIMGEGQVFIALLAHKAVKGVRVVEYRLLMRVAESLLLLVWDDAFFLFLVNVMIEEGEHLEGSLLLPFGII